MCPTTTTTTTTTTRQDDQQSTSHASLDCSFEDTPSNQLAEPLLQHDSNLVVENDGTSDDEEEPPPDFSGLLFYRSIYFLNGLSASTWGRFGVIYYNRVKHLNPAHIGMLQGITPILSFVSQPVWGWVADMIQSRKKIYILTKGCNTVLLLSLSLKMISSFWSILLVVCGMSFFRSGGVLDAHTLDFLGENRRGMYGSIRLWTAISWGLGAVIMGWITDTLGFRWNFGLFGGMMILNLAFIIFGLPARSKSEQECYERFNEEGSEETDNDNNLHSSHRPKFQVLKDAVLRLPVILWLIEVSIMGAAIAIVETFLFVYLQNDLNTSTELCGYTVGVTVLLELPIFHFSDYLLSKLGHDFLFIASMLAYSMRVFGYTFLSPETAHWVLALEFLHGITFACMWIASIDYAAAIAPKEWSTTVQSTLSTALSCVGGGLGPVLGGLVMNHYGAIFMFRGMALVVAATFVVHLFVLLVYKQGHGHFLQHVQNERQSHRPQTDYEAEEATICQNPTDEEEQQQS